MKKTFTSSLLSLVLSGFLFSCASIVHGPSQSIDLTSQPSGAKILIDGIEYGITPASVELMRKGRLKGENVEKKEYAVSIEMPGYYPYELKIKREMDGWFLGNLIFGGIIGIIVDASSGAMYKLTPDQIIAQMGQTTAMSMKNMEDRIYVAVSLNPDPSWERIGALEKME
jgi:hypothetical protein